MRDRGQLRHGPQLRRLHDKPAVGSVLDGKASIAYHTGGEDLAPEHGGPALLVPHLYLWKSAKWIRGIDLMLQDSPGFWEQLGYHDYGDPWREQRYHGMRYVAPGGQRFWSSGVPRPQVHPHSYLMCPDGRVTWLGNTLTSD